MPADVARQQACLFGELLEVVFAKVEGGLELVLVFVSMLVLVAMVVVEGENVGGGLEFGDGDEADL